MMMKISAKTKFLNFFRAIFKIEPLERWLSQRTAGHSPHYFLSKLVPNPYQFDKPTIRVIDRNGIKMKVDISDYLGHVYYFGFRDRSFEALLEHLPGNATVLDIGTNLGHTLLTFASRLDRGTVIGFEPDPINFANCKANVELNSFTNITLLNFGLGKAEGVLPMEVRIELNRGGNRINANAANTVNVPIRRLDSVVNEVGLAQIDVVKIDVEGFELNVLKGGVECLRKFKPVLFIELDDNNLRDQGDSALDVIEFLEGLGYTDIVEAESRMRISSSTNFANCHYDIIAR